ncbi:hypothetical protein [Acinetobacter gandensis]|uniref:hypothetical protein n=1 Tax=Acinetobacter gandensis TaxID=1443941 RepID=UPI00398962C5
MRANWLCGRFCVQASSFENYIAEKAFTDRFVQQSRFMSEFFQKHDIDTRLFTKLYAALFLHLMKYKFRVKL